METNRPKPGLHRGVSFDEYAAWDAVNNSLLGHILRSPAHARHYMVTAHEPTAAMIFGSAVHCAILEPDEFANRYTKAPQVDRRTKAGKDAWTAHQEANADRISLTPDEWQQANDLRDSVWVYNTIGKTLLGNATHNEVSAAWHDDKTGHLCKGRIDKLAKVDGWSTLIDLKTTEDASAGAFPKSIHKYGYHRQAAFYLDGLDRLAKGNRRFVILAVEKSPPYCCATYEVDEASIEEGRKLYREALNTYAACKANNHWPGYPSKIQPISIPSWAFTKGDTE